jgi:hypothetical protein
MTDVWAYGRHMFQRPVRRDLDEARASAPPEVVPSVPRSAETILALQRTIGNAAVARMYQSPSRRLDRCPEKKVVKEVEFELDDLALGLEELESAALDTETNPRSGGVNPLFGAQGGFNPLYGAQGGVNPLFGAQGGFNPLYGRAATSQQVPEKKEKKPAALPEAAKQLRTGVAKVERKIGAISAISGAQSNSTFAAQARLLLARWRTFLEQRRELLAAIKASVYSQPEEVKQQLLPIVDQEERQEIMADQFGPKGEHQFTGVLDAEGLLQAACTWEPLVDDEGVGYLYIHELASAPWNVWMEKGSEPQAVAGSGSAVMKVLVKKSIEAGYEGRLRLVAWSSSPGFYRKLGFVPKRIKRDKKDESVHELTPEAAAKLR